MDQQPQQELVAPNSPESEEALIGAVLIGGADTLLAVRNIQPHHFFIVRNRWIWQAIIDLHDAGLEFYNDSLPILEELRRRGQLATIGGAAYITYLMNGCTNHMHAQIYAGLVFTAYKRRRVLSFAQRAGDLAHSNGDIDSIMAEVENEWDEVAQEGDAPELMSMAQVVSSVIDDLDYRVEHPKDVSGFQLGIRSIDNLFGGFDRGWGTHWIMPTSSGKTFLTAQCVLHLAQQTGVLLVSTEMHTQPMIRRMLSQSTGIHTRDLRTGKLDRDTLDLAYGRLDEFAELPIWFVHHRRPTVQSVRRIAEKLKRKMGQAFGVVWVDSGSNIASERGSKIFDVTRDVATSLSAMAVELDVSLHATWQIKREAYAQQGADVTAGRGGGDIENEADMLFTIERPEYAFKTGKAKAPAGWTPNDTAEKVKWLCRKDRHMNNAGKSIDLWMRFQQPVGFFDVTPDGNGRRP